jgi:hypothetical protein
MLFTSANKIRQTLAFSIIILINLIFAFKYLSRVNDYAFILCIGYTLFLTIFYIFSKRIDSKFFNSNWLFYSLVCLYSLGHIILFHFIKVETLNVDRWSVISSFWNQAFHWQYPYNAQSHMGNYPAPLPFYFVLALPFNLLGEIGYLSLSGILILAVFLRKNLSPQNSVGALVFLFLSVSVFWEISTRSTILINSILFMVYLVWLEKVNFKNKRQFWMSAIIGGLLLSTRTIFALPLTIYVIYLFKSKEVTLKVLVVWSLIVVGVLIITFLPFLIFYFPEFLIRNPFNVQTDYLFPLNISMIFIFLSVISGFLCTKKREILFYTSGIFVLILITYFYLFIHKYGFMNAYFKSGIDLSYLFFAFPFLLYFSFSDNN